MRTIMLIDMDYFFVACEELRRPEIRDKPTIVGFDPKEGRGRGVVMTCNYIARKFGIRSGMPISMAYRIKPDAVYLPLDYDFYELKSKEVMDVLKKFAKKTEQVSVDEAFIDVSDNVSGGDEAIAFAEKIKKTIKDSTGLPCSIGIGPNKLISKMACESAKPNGIRLVKEDEARDFLKGMKVDDLYGIGKKTSEKLEAMGYRTIGELANANTMELMDKFGTYGIELHKYANGIDESKVEMNYEVKSIGREKTFEEDTKEREKVLEAIRSLSDEVEKELLKAGLSYKTVTVKMRYSDFTENLKSRSIRQSTNVNDMVHTAADLYVKYANHDKRLRKIGVRVSGLTRYRGQKSLA
jgi:DNA polymerase IV (archaeal DinB-like DNA polymerase)